ncbi:hypothetical protein LSCM1_08154 [Leishmania martiniquensis]|uniref:Uncharacterized protein n=1 Tax=Leishmania martiniquensis TaxID=1580590 RepID=A0A836KYY7_9TRYP|nr:hypothetical protein LSCM1_08154 [Leishmania martiniquensis]
MGNCCGVASATSTVARDGADSSPPPPPPPRHRRWRRSTKSFREESAALSQSAVGEAPSPLRGGSVDSRSIHGTAAHATAPAAPLVRSSAVPLTVPTHTLAVSVTAAPQYSASGRSPGLLVHDLCHISVSSSSALLTNGDMNDNAEEGIAASGDAGGQSSLVEVSQPTQSLRGDVCTCSEMDMVSEWDPPSCDRLGRRSERRGRCGLDRTRLRHLLLSEAEARASLAVMYTHQHQRLLLQLAQEWFIAVHIYLQRRYELKWAARCICGIVAAECMTREGLEREWLTERATLMRRADFSRSLPPPPPSARGDALLGTAAASPAVKREDSLPPVSSSYTAADLTSSEEAADDDTSNMCTPYMRASSLSALPTSLNLQQKRQRSTLSGPKSVAPGFRRQPRPSPRSGAPYASSSMSSPASPLCSSPREMRGPCAAGSARQGSARAAHRCDRG